MLISDLQVGIWLQLQPFYLDQNREVRGYFPCLVWTYGLVPKPFHIRLMPARRYMASASAS